MLVQASLSQQGQVNYNSLVAKTQQLVKPADPFGLICKAHYTFFWLDRKYEWIEFSIIIYKQINKSRQKIRAISLTHVIN